MATPKPKTTLAAYQKLGSCFEPVDVTSRTGRYLGEATTVDFARLDRRMEKLAAAGFNMLLLDLAEGVRYTSHPELALKGSVDPKELKRHLRTWTSLGLRCVPLLEFSALHCEWLGPYSRMVSTPKYYAAVLDLVREAAEIFDNPQMIHLGLFHEIRRWGLGRPYVSYRTNDLLWHDLAFYNDAVAKAGAYPWIWGDIAIEYQDDFIKKVSKRYLVSPSYFWPVRAAATHVPGEAEKKVFETVRRLVEAGYSVLPSFSTSGEHQRGRAKSVETTEAPAFSIDTVKAMALPGEKLRGYVYFPHVTQDDLGDRILERSLPAVKKALERI